jgi:hypothetical protein
MGFDVCSLGVPEKTLDGGHVTGNLCKGCISPRVQLEMETEFFTVAINICESQVCNIPRVTLQAPKNLRWLPDF